MSLADRLEEAAAALPAQADAIRPANGDPHRLLETLDAAGAGAVLRWLLEHAPEDGEDLASAWLDEDTGASIVGAVDEATLPKAGRKVLRRLRHAARSRGLAIGAGPAPAPRVARLPDVDQSISGAYVSPLDPRGARLVYLVEASPAGGAHVFEALIDRERGIVDFQLYRAGRRQVREFVRDVTGRKGGFAAVDAEASSVRALIARAAERHPASRPFPKPFAEWRSRLTRGADGVPTPGEQARAALGDRGASPESLDRLASLVRGRALGPWPPDPEALQSVVEALKVRVDAERDVAGAGLEAWADDALRPLYDGTSAEALAERFDECAYVYWRRDDEEIAQACLASASALREGRGAESPAVAALREVIAAALATDLKQSLGIGAGEGTEEEAVTTGD